MAAKSVAVAQQRPESAPLPTVAEVISYVRGLDQEAIDKETFTIYHTAANENSVVYIPPGFVLFEVAVGAQ